MADATGWRSEARADGHVDLAAGGVRVQGSAAPPSPEPSPVGELTVPGERRIRVASVGVLLGVVAVSQVLPAARSDFLSTLPPSLVHWDPASSPLLAVPLAIGVVFVFLLPKLLGARRAVFLGVLVAFVFATAVTLAMQDGHPRNFAGCCDPGGVARALTAPIQRESDYLENVSVVRRYGVVGFDRAYPWLARPHRHRLSLRASTHPPGAVLSMWALAGLTGDRPVAIALLIVAIAALAVLPTYAMARELHDERTARVACVLFAVCPIVLLYSATALDAVFMTVGACAMAALARAPRSAAWAAAAGVLTALALTMTYGLLALIPIGAGLFVLALRRLPRRVLAVRALVVVAALVATLLALKVFAGMDLWATFRQASRIQGELDAPRLRPYGYWVVGNPAAFLLMAGLGLAGLFVVQVVRAWRARHPGVETVLLVTMIASALSGPLRGETEHLWMFFVPLLVAVAAPAVRRVRAEAAGGLAQAALTQVFLWTDW
jgi:Dolichyl-phosphate-mannose-protein mannosyltransferase